MTEYIYEVLHGLGIELCAPIPIASCRVTRPYKLEKAGFSDPSSLTAFMLAVPYLTKQAERNISAYAVSRDYHGFFKDLFERVIPLLRSHYPQSNFCGFADDSPIDERDAAAMAGLGMIGENGMLITEKYSSYIFLGELITDLPVPEARALPIGHCEGCGRCKAACPMNELGQCLSALTQKKGELTVDEEAAIRKYGCAWGCDICQEVCPHTERAIKSGTAYTNIGYFQEELTPVLTVELIDGMSDEEFARRAYSWRKRPTVRRNLEILEK